MSFSLYSPNVPRCQHIKVNGTQCGSPAVRRNRFCFFHKRWHEQRVVINSARARQAKPSLDLPVLEDASSIQVALMQVMRLLLAGQIEHKTASLLLYGLQTASFNLRLTNFEPRRKHEVVIDPNTVDETPLGEPVWENSDYDPPEEEASASPLPEKQIREAVHDGFRKLFGRETEAEMQ